MSELTTEASRDQTSDMLIWLISIVESINAHSQLAPQKAMRKRIRDFIDNYGSASAWEAMKQCSQALGVCDASDIEDLYRKYPDLPALIQNDSDVQNALNSWFAANGKQVTGFRNTSSAMLRANPVAELTIDPCPGSEQNIEPIMDFLFHGAESNQQ